MPGEIDERTKLGLKVRATIEYNFGMICDEIRNSAEAGKMDPQESRRLTSIVRNEANSAIRVIESHLLYHKIVRNHKMDKPNIQNVAAKFATAKGE